VGDLARPEPGKAGPLARDLAPRADRVLTATPERLDLTSRILAVADVYDALSQHGPYRLAVPKEEALGIIREQGGKGLCPLSVRALDELASRRAP